ncbi:MAG: hypothetical protein AABZ06_11685 [Bdellovibrionota bacterium]
MDKSISDAIAILEAFNTTVDRAEVVAHATLSAFIHHWPSQSTAEMLNLLEDTAKIRIAEPSRWMTQRKIAIAKLAGTAEHLVFNHVN